MRLNPRFDGAFLNYTGNYSAASNTGLNPRFDGAFLNCNCVTLGTILAMS